MAEFRRKYTTEELASDAVYKKNIVLAIQERASFKFLSYHKLNGTLKNVVKHKTKADLIADYELLYETKLQSKSLESGPIQDHLMFYAQGSVAYAASEPLDFPVIDLIVDQSALPTAPHGRGRDDDVHDPSHTGMTNYTEALSGSTSDDLFEGWPTGDLSDEIGVDKRQGDVDKIPIVKQEDEHKVNARLTMKQERHQKPTETALIHQACRQGKLKRITQLIKRGAAVNKRDITGNTPLHIACMAGHSDVVDLLLEQGAYIEAANFSGQTPLFLACSNNFILCVRWLSDWKANLDAVDKEGFCAIHLAVFNNQGNVLSELLEQGADPERRTPEKATPLMLACQENNIECVKVLLDHHSYIEAEGEDGLRALHIACAHGNYECTQTLLAYKANVNIQSQNKITPLILAIKGGFAACVKLLLENKADVKLSGTDHWLPIHYASQAGNEVIIALLLKHESPVDCKTEDLLTPLHVATQFGHINCVSHLIDFGVDVQQGGPDGWEAIHYAAFQGLVHMVEYLTSKGSRVNAVTDERTSALILASQEGHDKCVRCLLANGADANIRAEDGLQALHVASCNGHTDTAKALLDKVDINVKTQYGSTPLLIATQSGQVQCAQFLLENEADPNIAKVGQWYPLHIACQLTSKVSGGSEEHSSGRAIAQHLLNYNAGINVQSSGGVTPLFIATSQGNTDCVELLLSRAADPILPDARGWRPIHAAAASGNIQISKLLIDIGVNPIDETHNKETPLLIASRSKRNDMVEYLQGLINDNDVVLPTKLPTLQEAADESRDCILRNMSYLMEHVDPDPCIIYLVNRNMIEVDVQKPSRVENVYALLRFAVRSTMWLNLFIESLKATGQRSIANRITQQDTIGYVTHGEEWEVINSIRNLFKCHVCDLVISGIMNLTQHLRGKLHTLERSKRRYGNPGAVSIPEYNDLLSMKTVRNEACPQSTKYMEQHLLDKEQSEMTFREIAPMSSTHKGPGGVVSTLGYNYPLTLETGRNEAFPRSKKYEEQHLLDGKLIPMTCLKKSPTSSTQKVPAVLLCHPRPTSSVDSEPEKYEEEI